MRVRDDGRSGGIRRRRGGMKDDECGRRLVEHAARERGCARRWLVCGQPGQSPYQSDAMLSQVSRQRPHGKHSLNWTCVFGAEKRLQMRVENVHDIDVEIGQHTAREPELHSAGVFSSYLIHVSKKGCGWSVHLMDDQWLDRAGRPIRRWHSTIIG